MMHGAVDGQPSANTARWPATSSAVALEMCFSMRAPKQSLRDGVFSSLLRLMSKRSARDSTASLTKRGANAAVLSRTFDDQFQHKHDSAASLQRTITRERQAVRACLLTQKLQPAQGCACCTRPSVSMPKAWVSVADGIMRKALEAPSHGISLR